MNLVNRKQDDGASQAGAAGSGANRPRGALTLLLLGLVLLLCVPVYVARIGVGQVRYHMEALTFLTSQETWLRQGAGESDAWMHPTMNGVPRYNKPPLTVWANMLAWDGLTAKDDIARLVVRSRLGAVAMIAMALASVFWIGSQLGGRRLAFAAALATGSMFIIVRQARLATYDTHLAGWVTLCIAAGLCALRAGCRPTAIAGTVLAGAALAAAWLTKGPIALVLAAAPLVVMAWTLPGNRRAGLRIAVAVVLIACVLVLPWYAWFLSNHEGAASALARELRAERSEYKMPWYYVSTIWLVFPWSLWFVAGLVLAFRTWKTERERLGVPYAWFATVLILLSLHESKRERYILPALPAAGVLAAMSWFSHVPWSERVQRRLGRIHWGIAALVTALFAVFVALQDLLVRRGVIRQPELPVEDRLAGVLIALALLAPVIYGARAHARGRRMTAFVCTAVWMLGLLAFVNHNYVHSYHCRYEQLADCRKVDELVGRSDFFYLFTEPVMDVKKDPPPDAKFLIYSRRVVPPASTSDVSRLAASGKPVYVTTLDRPGPQAVMLRAGFSPLLAYRDGGAARVLYRGGRGE